MSPPSPADEEPRTLPPPLELAVDVFVYAPLGFALDVRQQFPGYVERGRREVHAVTRWAGRRARDAAREATAALRGLGVDVGAPPDEDDEAPIAPPALSVVPDPDPVPAATAEVAATGADPSAAIPEATSTPAEPAIDPERLAIPGYESLSASQVVPRLVSLTPDELELIRRYEAGARGRKTILSRIAQLQAG